MSEVKPVFEVHPANRSIRSSLPGRFPFDPFFSPVSPKLHELRVRYEALHATGKKLKPSIPGSGNSYPFVYWNKPGF